MAKKKRPARSRSGNKRLADLADRYDLYLKSVQAPDVDVHFFDRAYRASFGVHPRVLREDFCGTAAVCCEWAKRGRDRMAYGVDLDPEPLAWGERHNLAKLDPRERARVVLVEGDVRTARSTAADVVAAQNFSYCIFRERPTLRDYFRSAHRHLGTRGIFVLDLFGGSAAIVDDEEDVIDHGKFDYVWHQVRFDPITHEGVYHIHFRFPDGSEFKRAFTYEWRLWTIPEVAEVLVEAGFSRADVYWEDTDHESGEGSGVYRRRTHGESDPAWNVYIVGVKGDEVPR